MAGSRERFEAGITTIAKGAVLAFALVIAVAPWSGASAQAVNTTTIGASTLSGGNGAFAINQSAGVANQEANSTLVTNGGSAHLGINQLSYGQYKSAAAGNSAQIGAQVFAGTSGIMQLNQTSGSGNIEANAAFIGIGGSGTALASISLSQMRGGTDQPVTPGPAATEQTSIAPSAFSGASGLAQVQQISGNNNVAANTMALHIGTGLIH
ncbi:MAG: hypothetical protein ACREQ4_00435 [Candidatus Binataceae bacterium]